MSRIMQKTKLGISVGLFGAALYLLGLFSGYLIAVLMAGYVLLFEENGWLRRTAVKAIAVKVAFSFLSVGISLIPNAISIVNGIILALGGEYILTVVLNLVNIVVLAVNMTETVLFFCLGLKALNQRTIVIPAIDALIDRCMR